MYVITCRTPTAECIPTGEHFPKSHSTKGKIKAYLHAVSFEHSQWQNEAAAQFVEAKRPDLAEIEQQEAELLSKFLPPLLSAADIDVHMKAALDAIPSGTDPLKVSNLLFKEFYSRVDKPLVDSNLVKERAQALLDAREQS